MAMAMAQPVTKLTMMATRMTMATGNDDNVDSDGVTGDGAARYNDDDDGDGWR